MYIKNALVLGSGALEDIELEFEFNGQGLPKPMVLVGKNGTGKSNFLAFVTDALIEIAAQKFTDVAPPQPQGGHVWHRVVGGPTIRSGSAFELALLRFEGENSNFSYVSKGGTLERSAVAARLSNFPDIPNWPVSEAYKSVVGPTDNIEALFINGCYASFPTGRAERPYWSADSAGGESSLFQHRLSNLLRKPISITSSMSEIKPWLVDVLLDQAIDFFQLAQGPEYIAGLINDAGRSATSLHNFNALLKIVLRNPSARLVRVGRQYAERKLMVFEGDKILLPSLDSFSSGQAMLIGIFTTILRYADKQRFSNPTENLTGIVLIDEADSHLHADFQHDVLPQLISLFPRIQFIISAHSPLFPLGMERMFGEDGISLIEFPKGTRINAERFSEFQSSFEYLVATKSFDEAVVTRAKELHRPLVLCEGPTDPKYLRTAAELLDFSDLASGVDFDWIGSLSNGQAKDGGDGQLRQARKLFQNNIYLLKANTVLLFDCDQRDTEIDDGLLHVRVLRRNEKNKRCDRGIENLLPPSVFTKSFFRSTKRQDGPNTTISTSLDKVALCNYLCDEKRDARDFANFRGELERLRSALSLQGVQQQS